MLVVFLLDAVGMTNTEPPGLQPSVSAYVHTQQQLYEHPKSALETNRQREFIRHKQMYFREVKPLKTKMESAKFFSSSFKNRTLLLIQTNKLISHKKACILSQACQKYHYRVFEKKRVSPTSQENSVWCKSLMAL